MEHVTSLAALKVPELKAELRERGLPLTGNKTDLINRLQQARDEDNDINPCDSISQQGTSLAPSQSTRLAAKRAALQTKLSFIDKKHF